MPEEGEQRELFEEFNIKKGKFEKIADKVTQKRRRFYVQTPLENIIFAAIVLIMCVIVAFALGVERGKRLVHIEEGKVASVSVSAAPEPMAENKAVSDRAVVTTPLSHEAPYTIQLISYRAAPDAEKERDELSDKKIEAFIVRSGQWHGVCAGSYRNIKKAEAALKGFKKNYKDCFIRKGVK